MKKYLQHNPVMLLPGIYYIHMMYNGWSILNTTREDLSIHNKITFIVRKGCTPSDVII